MMWDFIQTQILGMKWLSILIGKLLSALGVDTDSRIGGSIQFFFYDVIKISIFLCVLIFVISYIQSFFPPERSRKLMGKFRGIGANIVGALLGTVTPFCSCSSIPIFMGFTSAGLPLGVTFSFLISSPMVDLGSLVLLMSIFGVVPIAEALLASAKEAVAQKGIDAEIEYITDMEKIMGFGVMSMPALIIDGKVVSVGKVLKAKDVEKLL